MTPDEIRAARDEAKVVKIISIIAASRPELLERVPEDTVRSIALEAIREQRRYGQVPPAFRKAFE